MKRLAIIGSGDLAKQIAHHATNDNHYIIVGSFDDFLIAGTVKNDLQILGNIDAIEEAFKSDVFDVLMIGIGYQYMTFRAELFKRFETKIPFGKIVHSSCFVDKTAKIGEGTIIYPGCIIDLYAVVGENCLIYNGCIIAHDSSIAKHSIFSPGVQIAGFCSIGENVILGIGTIVSDNITIVENVRTGAGTVVVKSITEVGLYIGIPAKKVKS